MFPLSCLRFNHSHLRKYPSYLLIRNTNCGTFPLFFIEQRLRLHCVSWEAAAAVSRLSQLRLAYWRQRSRSGVRSALPVPSLSRSLPHGLQQPRLLWPPPNLTEARVSWLKVVPPSEEDMLAPSICWLGDNANMKKVIWVAQMLAQPLQRGFQHWLDPVNHHLALLLSICSKKEIH